MTGINPTIWVGVIEWSDGEEPNLFAATSEYTLENELARKVIAMWSEAPLLFHDEAPAFMAGVTEDQHLDASEFLEGLKEATTSPWVTIQQKEIKL